MVDISTQITIHAPIQIVSAYASNPDNAPTWYENIHSAKWITPPPLQLGTQIAFVAQFLGRKLEYTYEITQYISNEILVMKTAEGPFPMETTYTWNSVDSDQTVMTLRNRGEPKGFSKLFKPMMAFMMRKANQKDLQAIKQILESHDSSI